MVTRAPEHWNRRNDGMFIGRLTPLKTASVINQPLNRTYTISEDEPGGVDILVIEDKEPSFDSDSLEYPKQFLQGFQVLETIDKILHCHSEGKDFLGDLDASFSKIIKKTVKKTVSKTSPLSLEDLRSLAFYRDKLKLLLKEWSFTELRNSCFVHVRDLRRFVKVVAGIASEESNKLKLLSYGKPVDGTNIYFGKKQTLLSQLAIHTSHWSQILQTVHRTINVFHLEWDSSLNALLSRTQASLASLLNEAFYWIYCILLSDYELLASNDQQPVTTDTLQNYYHTSDVYIKLLAERKWKVVTNRKCSVCVYGFVCSLCSVENFSYAFLMKVLGHLQGNCAGTRVVETLSSEMKKIGVFKDHGHFYWLANKFTLRPGTETSDYYSASRSERGRESANASVVPSGSFSVLTTLLPSYQASLLKHLFALTCMQSLQPENPKPHEARRRRRKQHSAGRQTWSRGSFRASGESSSTLEKVFWAEFWKHLELHVMSLTWKCSGKLQKPGRLGMFCVLPSHLTTLVWKKFIGSDISEINPEVLLSMQRVFQQLIYHSELGAWDDRFCSALTSSVRSRDSPTPLTDGTTGSACGKLMCDALEPVIASVFTSKENVLFSTKGLLFLQCTVDHLINWAVVSQAANLSGWNVSLFLLVGLSDLKRAYEMLEMMGSNWTENNSLLSAALGFMWKLPAQKDLLREIQDSLPSSLYKGAYKQCVQLFEVEIPSCRYWRKKKRGEKHLYVLELVSSILEPVVGTATKVEASLQPAILRTTANAIGAAWIDTIHKKKLKFSISGAEHLKEDLFYVQSWISKSPASEEAQDHFLSASSFNKLNGMVHILTSEEPATRPLSGLSRNRVAPNDTINRGSAAFIITKEDRDAWETLRARKSFSVCCF